MLEGEEVGKGLRKQIMDRTELKSPLEMYWLCPRQSVETVSSHGASAG